MAAPDPLWRPAIARKSYRAGECRDIRRPGEIVIAGRRVRDGEGVGLRSISHVWNGPGCPGRILDDDLSTKVSSARRPAGR